ncbi:MAG: hypothetical protein JWL92_677 [Candidatus Nomurabacteria bacterium]|nr:hypothetical protein [Candidatus Nomurabacteria bacterium]
MVIITDQKQMDLFLDIMLKIEPKAALKMMWLFYCPHSLKYLEPPGGVYF